MMMSLLHKEGLVGKGAGRRSWACLWLLLPLLVLQACKEEDRDTPAVALSSPSEGFVIMADSEFVIAGVASDDRALGSVTAVLYESFTEAVVQSKTEPLGGLRDEFSFRMPAGDRYTPSGEYTLRVSAADAAGNIGSAFAQITIQALPLRYRGLVWACDVGAGQYTLHMEDSLQVVRQGPQQLTELAGLLCDNRNGQAVTAEAMPGVLIGWDIEGLDKVFQVDLSQGTGTRTFSGLTMNASRYYCALSVPSYLRSYRFDGAPVDEFEDALHPGTAICAAGDRVFMALKGLVGTPLKVDAYDAATGALEGTYGLDWEAQHLLPVGDDALLVAGNENGLGRVLVLDRTSLALRQAVPMTESLVDVATANGRVWVIGGAGLYELYPATGTLSGLLAAGDYAAIATDAEHNHVFLGGDGSLEQRSGAGALLRTIPVSGRVAFIDTHYNK